MYRIGGFATPRHGDDHTMQAVPVPSKSSTAIVEPASAVGNAGSRSALLQALPDWLK
jgi:hypothetical protein